MAGRSSPRELLQSLLAQTAPSRPVYAPNVFSLGARIENVSLRSFLTNPTKITNALRQLRGALRADALTCYFDRTLEAEALGAALRWHEDNAPPELAWPDATQPGALFSGLRSPEGAAASGRVPIAVEVIRRLKSLLRDEVLFSVRVTGPFTLAAQLLQLDRNNVTSLKHPPEAALELSSATITQISSALVAAGANLLLLCEERLPVFSTEAFEQWIALLGPALNVVGFYQAVPVLVLSAVADSRRYAKELMQRDLRSAVCVSGDSFHALASPPVEEARPALLGLAVPSDYFAPGRAAAVTPTLKSSTNEGALRPAIVTTDGDIPVTTDPRRVIGILEAAAG